MFVWINRDAFKVKGSTAWCSFNSLVSIGIYGDKLDYRKKIYYFLQASFSNGDKLRSDDHFETIEEAENALKKFWEARPNNEKTKIKIT